MSRPSTRCSTIFHALSRFPWYVHRRTSHCRVYPCPAVHVTQYRAPAVLGRRIYPCITPLQPHTPTHNYQHVPRHRVLPMDSAVILSRTSTYLFVPVLVSISLTSIYLQIIANGGFFITNMV